MSTMPVHNINYYVYVLVDPDALHSNKYAVEVFFDLNEAKRICQVMNGECADWKRPERWRIETVDIKLKNNLEIMQLFNNTNNNMANK